MVEVEGDDVGVGWVGFGRKNCLTCASMSAAVVCGPRFGIFWRVSAGIVPMGCGLLRLSAAHPCRRMWVGVSHSWLLPTRRSSAPMKARISVADGSRLITRIFVGSYPPSPPLTPSPPHPSPILFYSRSLFLSLTVLLGVLFCMVGYWWACVGGIAANDGIRGG